MKDRSRNARRSGMPPLIAWSVSNNGELPEDGGEWALVYARTEFEARRIALPHVSERYSARYSSHHVHHGGFAYEPAADELEVSRSPEADPFAREDRRVEGRPRVLRLAGWRCESDRGCSSCSLAEWDGEFPLCDDCHCCEECGHADDCPTRPAVERLAAAKASAARYLSNPDFHPAVGSGCTPDLPCWRCRSWADEIADLEREVAGAAPT